MEVALEALQSAPRECSIPRNKSLVLGVLMIVAGPASLSLADKEVFQRILADFLTEECKL